MSARITAYVYTRDLDRLRKFYEAGLGVRASGGGSWLPFDLGGATFALHAIEPESDRDTQRVNLTLDVADIEEALERFVGGGAKVLRGISDEAFGKQALLEDPDGRAFSLVQQDR